MSLLYPVSNLLGGILVLDLSHGFPYLFARILILLLFVALLCTIPLVVAFRSKIVDPWFHSVDPEPEQFHKAEKSVSRLQATHTSRPGPKDSQRVTCGAGGDEICLDVCKMPVLSGLAASISLSASLLANPLNPQQRLQVIGDIEALRNSRPGAVFVEDVWDMIVSRSTDFSPAVQQLHKEMRTELATFISLALRHVPDMCHRDIQRAASNVWPMLYFQQLRGHPARLTNTMLGFSLLYPLTDDVLDDTSIPKSVRKDFAARFSRLVSHGDSQPNGTLHESRVWHMFQLIEDEWPRAEHPKVYALISRFWGSLGRDSAKGALQLLCDAHLANPGSGVPVSHDEDVFASHFGAVVQFVNDARTVDEDLAVGQYTAFNLLHERGESLDAVVEWLLWYFQEAFERDGHTETLKKTGSGGGDPGATAREGLVHLIRGRLTFEFLVGVARNAEKLSPQMVEGLERHSVLPLDLMRQLEIL
ncbi:hypothetical protein H2203_009005 [Taxawa tesnikishii (nom. ined.)]|nr:hypothetical protein H2203_009005 [Dothideales sp. JES 119]